MLDDRVIKVLEYLQPFGFTSTVNIAPIIDQIFKYNPDDIEFDFSINQRNVNSFIRGLTQNDLIEVHNQAYMYNITSFSNRHNLQTWYGNGLETSITKSGLDVLSDYKKNKLAEEAHEAATLVSNSIIQTNKSVKDTNTIVGSVSKTQRNLAYISLLIVAISTAYLILTYYKSDSPALILISKQLQRQERLLDSMSKSQKGIDSSIRIIIT